LISTDFKLAASKVKCNTCLVLAQCQQLQPEEPQGIASLYLEGSSIRAMARILGRSPATVSGELTRNRSAVGYASVLAKRLSVARRSAGRRPNALPAKRWLARRSHFARVEMVAPTDIGHT